MGVTGLLLVGPFYFIALYWGVYHCIKERIESINCWGYSDRNFGLNALAQRFENNDIAPPISIYSCHTYKTVLQYTQLQYDFM